MMIITNTTPRIPLGRYPQPRLWGQIGMIPSNARTTMMRSIVPNDMDMFLNMSCYKIALGSVVTV